MMNQPPVSELEKKAGCRYALVTAVAKRARQLLNDPDALGTRKPVAAAVDELWNDKVQVTAEIAASEE